jgi:Ca2+-binding RTX toxin-like protein
MTFRSAARTAAAALVCAATLAGGTNAAHAVEPDGADIDFILAQIKKAEAHAAGGNLLGPGVDQVGDTTLPYGLRTVNGHFNNLVSGQEHFGSADRLFPRLLTPFFRNAEPFDPDGPTGPQPAAATSYADKTGPAGIVQDSSPRTISNLINDASGLNPAAVTAAGGNPSSVPPTSLTDPKDSFFIPNVAPDAGLSAPYNSWFTLFGQFFDHGLDLVTKGNSGTVVIPLKEDDPLYEATSNTNFMVLTRATNQKGTDGLIGTADDVQQHQNTTTPFVDQNQTYTSHPSHQVFLREYEPNGVNRPVANGRLLDQPTVGGLARWTDIKAQAQNMLGIALDDQDLLNVPLVLTDQYGKFIPNPATGMAQIVTNESPLTLASGTPASPVNATLAVRTGHAFLDDIAHAASPFGETDTSQATPRGPLTADTDTDTSNTPAVGFYDDELLDQHFITGDGRGNENIGLTTVHHVFHAEHNLRVNEIKLLIEQPGGPNPVDWQLPTGAWDGERLFQAARFVTEMEYQHLVFEEFARKVQPQVNLFAGYDSTIDPAIVAEFAHTVYRFGHSMLTETISRKTPTGESYDVGLIPAFLNPLAFNDGPGATTLTPEQAAGGIVRGMSRQVGNELDEFVTGALRNNLVGLPLDLATINIARGRDTGIPSLNAARRTFFAQTSNSALRPYDDWNDFKLGLRNQASLVNFIAAYGQHPSITGNVAARRAAAGLIVNGGAGAPADRLDFLNGTGTTWSNTPAGVTRTGVDEIDFWVGGLAEKQMVFGGLLGSTFNFVFEVSLEKLQDGDRFYYLSRNAGLNFLTQLEENSFSELINRTTDTKHLPFDVFSRPDFIFEFANINANGAGAITDDPNTPEVNEADVLSKAANGTVRFAGTEHTVFGGTPQNDRMQGSEGDDTFWGDEGDDRIEGGDGVDSINGDLGDDIITDLNGDDNIKGGPGGDAINAGPGFDLLLAGAGNDFVVAGADPKETFAGGGDDFVIAGDSADTVFGDAGADWIEGGGQADLLQGEHGDPFQQGRVGDDVIDGGGGNDDYDSEGGDDILVAGSGTERMEGQFGFDWVTYARTPGPQDIDLFFTGLQPPDIDNIRDRFDNVEGVSGWDGNDVIRGSDATSALLAPDHALTRPALIDGLQANVLGGATSYADGDILLGGNGADIIEGRIGNDIIDGDRWLNVRLSVRTDPNNPATETQTATSMTALQSAVFAGTINPNNIKIVREIITPAPSTVPDTAVFSGPRADYDITPNFNSTLMTISHTRGAATDGIDTVRNIEKLQFADVTLSIVASAAVTPTALTFAARNVGTTSPSQSVTLTNSGADALVISGITRIGAAAADYARPAGAAGGTCPATFPANLAGGASCTIATTFSPTAAGARNATLRITDNHNGVAGSTQDVALTGTGNAVTPLAAVSPGALTFAARQLNTTSPSQTVTLTNGGGSPLTIASITRVGANAAEFARPAGAAGGTCPTAANATLAAGASCTVTTTFRPTATGARTAQLRFTDNAGGTANSVQNVNLTGSGVNATLSATPSPLAFGNNSVGPVTGGNGVLRNLTVRNTGPAGSLLAVTSTQIIAGQTSGGQFFVQSNNCPTAPTLASNATCTIVGRFRATGSPGARNATLRINNNTVATPQLNVPVSGTATPGGLLGL